MNLIEAMRKKREETQQQSQTDYAEPEVDNFADAFGNIMSGQDTKQLPAKLRGNDAQEPAQTTDTPELRQAGRERTQTAMADIEADDEVADKFAMLRNMNVDDEISDEEAARNAGRDEDGGTQPVDITTLPAVINQDIAAAGNVEPEWHQVKHLPGYLAKGIRAMGRQVFSTFTETPIDDIQVVANLGGRGPNEHRELNAVAGWLQKNAKQNTKGEMDFKRSLGDYDAEFAMYTAKDFTFLVVTDFAGQYIYSWPTADEKKAIEGSDLGIEQEFQRRLGRE